MKPSFDLQNRIVRHHVKILAVSDIIDQSLIRMVEEKRLEPVDLIISCGDLAPEYLSFLKEKLEHPLFYVQGNHDIRYTSSHPLGCENIHGKMIRFKTLNILGLEGSNWYNGGPNQYTDKQMSRIISGMWLSFLIKGKVHMVITHAPPRHIHDAEDRCHNGFDSFVKLMGKRSPQYWIHGHIHKTFDNLDQRTTQVDTTKVINTCGFTIFEV